MSVDVESWVHRPIFNIPPSEQTKELDGGHVLDATRIILELFRKCRTKATFFVLGTIVEWYPELIKEMQHDGHEIGIHGYSHTLLSNHTRESFHEEIKRTVHLLNSMGVSPRGYRSPSFSDADFLCEVIHEYGITYDSSVFPLRTPLYDGTLYDSRPFILDHGIVEIPCSVLKILGLRIPVGGFYLRLLGKRLNYHLLQQIEKRYGIAVMYVHPWEILSLPNRIIIETKRISSLPFMKKRFAFYKIPMRDKLEYLVRKIEFTNYESAGHDIYRTFFG